jgi:hypothetical protein
MRDAGTEFGRNEVCRWFPVRADEELFWVVVFIVSVGEEHLCVDVSSEAIGALQEFVRARGKLGLDAEV